MTESTARRQRFSPLLVIVLVVVALIVCAGLSVGGYFLARNQGWLPGTEKTELLRMLAFVPDRADFREEIWFGDFCRLVEAYDMPEVKDYDDLNDLSDEERTQWMQVSRNVWRSNFAGAQRGAMQWRDVFGYDWFQLDREITVGQPPKYFGVMKGTFDADNIQDALDELDYKEDEYEGTAYYHIRDDFEIELKHEGSRIALASLNRIMVSESMIVAAPATDILEKVLDAQAGRRDSLADDPTYAALARAMGPVVSAAILEGERFHNSVAVGLGPNVTAEMQEEIRKKLAELYSEPLHPYELVGFGYLDDSDDQEMVIALAYDDSEDAEADAPVLADRLEDAISLTMHDRTLSDYWRVGEPETHSFKGGSILAIKLELDDDAPHGLWLIMLMQRDVTFLNVGE